MKGGMSGRPTECRHCRYPAPRDVAMATTFCLSMGYKFGCMIASDTLFDSGCIESADLSLSADHILIG